MKLVYFVLVGCSVLFSSCGSVAREDSNGSVLPAADSSQRQGKLSEREYGVLSTILDATRPLVIRSNTRDDYRAKVPDDFVSSFPGLSTETIRDYNLKNSTPVPVECKFPGVASCELLAPEEERSMWDFTKENATSKWKGFEARHGTNRYVSVSRVGFNLDGTQAFAYTTSTCGTLCFDGHLYFLTRDQEGWKISKKQLVSVS